MGVDEVIIVGGTHGNEYTGICLLDCLKQRNYFKSFSSLNVKTFFANPKAYENDVRFIDVDLNRCFTESDLNNSSICGYEAQRAKEINGLFGPKGKGGDSLIIDVHTTTSNMGITLVLSDTNSFNLKLSAYVKSKMPEVNICSVPPNAYESSADHPYLNSITKYGISIEVGPIANSVIRHDVLEQTRDAPDACLEFVKKLNDEEVMSLDDQLEIYEYVKTVEYPKDSKGNIDAFVHKELQDSDFAPLRKGDPIFEKMNGELVVNEEEEVLYPSFINEAAYYYKKYAFTLNRKVSVTIA